MLRRRSSREQFLVTLVASSLVSCGLFMYGALQNHSFATFIYLPLNLILAWLPLIFAVRLMVVLRSKLWSSWEGLLMSTLWLVFLPNSFYMISDFIHLQIVPTSHILYDALMFTMFIATGVALGFSSLYLVHTQLRRRLTPLEANFWIGLTLFLSSCAIYLGRDLRWNSWDIVTNPTGLLFDVSDSILHPAAHPQMIMTIFVFFIVLATTYSLLWRGSALLGRNSSRNRLVRYVALYGAKGQAGVSIQHPLLKEHLVYMGYCHIPGRLKKLPDHGRAVTAAAGDVVGELYMLKDLQVLPQLDEYVASDNLVAKRPGYTRVLARLNRPNVLAWVYFYEVPATLAVQRRPGHINN